MRTIIFIITILFITTEIALSQYTFPYFGYPQGPFPRYSPSRITGICSIRDYNEKGEEIMLPPGQGISDIELIRSKDDLTDTITYVYGTKNTRVYTYSENNLLLSSRLLITDSPSQLVVPINITDYEYDAEDRVIKQTMYHNEVIEKGGRYMISTRIKNEDTYDYTQNTVTHHNRFYFNDSEYTQTVRYSFTSTGYIEYSGEEQTEYIFDDKNRLIQQGDIYTYIYQDNGYTELFKNIWEPDSKISRKDYIYDENGFRKEEIFYNKDETGNWQVDFRREYTFNEFTVSNEKIEPYPSSIKVSVTASGIIVEAQDTVVLLISTIAGQQVVNKKLEEGQEFIPLSEGIYIINVGKESHKILVR